MRKYDKEFKEEAVKLSDEVGVKRNWGCRITHWQTGVRSARPTATTLLSGAESAVTRR